MQIPGYLAIAIINHWSWTDSLESREYGEGRLCCDDAGASEGDEK